MSYPLNDGPISVIISSFVFMLHVWLAFVGLVVANFNRGDVGWEERIGPTEGFGAFMNGCDGAKTNELIIVKAEAAVVVAEELFVRGGNAGMAAPDFVEERRYDAVMHVPGEDKVKIFEIFTDGFFFEECRGVNKEDFGLVFREFFEGIGDFFEGVEENLEIFRARMEFAVVIFRR